MTKGVVLLLGIGCVAREGEDHIENRALALFLDDLKPRRLGRVNGLGQANVGNLVRDFLWSCAFSSSAAPFKSSTSPHQLHSPHCTS